MKKSILALCAVALSLSMNAAELKGTESDNRIKGTQELRFTENSTIPDYIKFSDSSLPEVNMLEGWLKTNAGLNADCGFKLLSTETDKIGYVHYRYQQTYLGYPLLHTMYIAHTMNGRLVSANGFLSAQLPKSLNNSLTEAAALQNALQNINATVYKWELAEEENFLKREQENPAATFFPKGELVLAANANDLQSGYQLAWQFDIYAHEPMQRYYIYVDAQNGKIIEKLNRIHEGNANGSALTGYSGTQAIRTDSTAVNNFRLRETGRGLGVETYNMLKGTSYGAAVDFTDTDNYWNNVNANKDQYATDAHLATEKTYDYFFNTYGRNSINNAGLKLLSYVHYSNNYVNAFWDGSRMTYGDGNATYNPLTSLDIGGHEVTHGLTSYTANLNYSYQSGALNESFSDIFGTTIENYAAPAYFDWLIGEDIGGAFRSHSNPNAYGDPDTYLGTNWYAGSGDNGGVHTNSGVQNHWFYLLTLGGTGTNDIGNAYSVTGIGMANAAAIAYRNLTVYLTPTSQYADARFYSIQAATDLFGACSQQVISTNNAWYAVGVGTGQIGAAATISAGGPTTFCNGSSVTLTANGASGSTYQWKLNGSNIAGATSSTYSANQSGSYTCSTVTCGSSFTSAATTVTVNSIAATISPSGTVDICNGGTATLNANNTTGYGYQWNLNGSPIGGATSSSYVASASGNYSVSYLAQTFSGQTQTNSTVSNILDNTCTNAANTSIVISGFAGNINPAGITVTVNLTHTYNGDIDVMLVAPNGDVLGFSNGAGGAGDNYVNTVFSDAGATTLASGAAPFTGTFKPWATTWTSCIPVTKTSFASLGNGSINPNGTWTLRVYDRFSQDIGTLNNWTLNIPSYTVPSPNCGPATSPVTTVNIGSLSVNAGTYSAVCTNASPVALAGTPTGGTFSGTGVSGNSFDPTGLAAGTYPVTYNYTNGSCSGSASSNIMVNALPSVSAGTYAATCQNASLVSLSGTPSGGTFSGTGVTGNSFDPGVGAGTYQINYSYTDANGCAASNNTSILVNSLPTVTATDASGCEGTAITLLGTPPGGTFSVPNPYSGASATYTYSYTDGNGCTNTSTPAIITVNPLPTVSANNVSGCAGTSIALSGVPAGGTWSVANPYTGGSTTYTHSYTDANGCSNISTPATIAVNANPTPSISGSTSFCAGSSTTLDAGAGAISYSWSTGATSQSISVNSANTFTVTVTDANGCNGSTSATTTVNPLPTVSFSGLAASYNLSAPAATLTGSPSGGTFSGPGISGNTFTASAAGVGGPYTIVYSYTDANGCSNSSSHQTTVTNCAAPAQPGSITATGGNTKVCPGDSKVYSIAAVSGATSYTWTTPTGASIASGQGSTSVTINYTAAFTASGTLSIVSNNACSASAPRTLAITRNTPSTPSTVTGAASAVCAGTSGTYSVTNVIGMTYNWTAPANASIGSGQGTNIVVVNFSALFTSGSLTVTANNGCGTSGVRSQSILSKPSTPGTISGTASSVCAGTTGSYSVTNVSGVTYNWTAPANASISSGQGTNSVVVNFSGSFISGSLTVAGTNACGSSALRSLAIASVPGTPGTMTGPAFNNCNATSSFSIAAVVNATSYTWSTNVAGAVVTPSGTSCSISFPAFSSGTVSVKANNACGSSALRNLTIKGTVATPAAITGNIAVTSCVDESYSITPLAGATSYIWTVPSGSTIVSGQGTSSVTVHFGATSGSITAKGVNACGNGSSKSLAVTVGSCSRFANETTPPVNYSTGDFVIHPNPFTTSTTVTLSAETDLKNTEIVIFDILGNEVKRISAIEDYSVAIEKNNLTPGVYLLKINSNIKSLFAKKLIIQ